MALVEKNPPTNARDLRDAGSIPGSGRSPWGGHRDALQYSYLENPTDRKDWQATVHGVTENQTWLKRLQFNSVQLLSRVRLFATLWTAARQASLSITNSRSSLKHTSIESVMPSSHVILCRPLLLLPPIPLHTIKMFGLGGEWVDFHGNLKPKKFYLLH